jgi:hypothetical protein
LKQDRLIFSSVSFACGMTAGVLCGSIIVAISQFCRRLEVKRIAVLATLVLTFAAGSAFAESFTGWVSDAMCAKNPDKVSSADHAACAKKCIEGGSPAVLVVAGKVYQVSNPDMLKEHAGEKVTVDATMDNGTLTIKSVK